MHCLKGTQTIVGATIVAAAAGEMISELTLAIQHGIPLGARGVGGVIHCYPTVADAIGGASWVSLFDSPLHILCESCSQFDLLPRIYFLCFAQGYKMANWRTVERVMGPGGSEPATLRINRDGADGSSSSSTSSSGDGGVVAAHAVAALSLLLGGFTIGRLWARKSAE